MNIRITHKKKVTSVAASDIGLVRHNNEDVYLELPALETYILADGMGGHQAGEVAASEAVKSMKESLEVSLPKADQQSLEEAVQAMKAALEAANSHVFKMGRADTSLRGMGTTLCCVHIHPEGVVYGHVGDSRIYRFRQGILEQLTRDHSLVREMVDIGQIDEREATDCLYKNIITRAIGTESSVIPSVRVDLIEHNDLFLLCSDGLSDLLSLQELQEILNTTSSLEDLTRSLIAHAKARGGHDNVTVVLVNVQDLPRS